MLIAFFNSGTLDNASAAVVALYPETIRFEDDKGAELIEPLKIFAMYFAIVIFSLEFKTELE
ncbi:hypothetical protein J6P59_06330 [bacterium]|nr:hypothetical protein [bacterium]